MQGGTIIMANLTEKELSGLKDLLGGEELLIKKFQMLADQTDDQALKNKLSGISQMHQEHYNTLYSKIN